MRHLDLAALRSLVSIAETRSVTQAAAMNFLTQSAVSMQALQAFRTKCSRKHFSYNLYLIEK
ncbi:MAG TPA: LysR family transcriptional regulator [Woeseiaceae bacterium]|nr:LysR family transcriptional regulator [Woeseiaceae bacterium]